MSFLAPQWLWLLGVVAGLASIYVILQHRRRHYAVRFTNLDLLSSLAPKRPGWRRHVAAGLVGLGLVAMVLAIARPVRNEKVARESATVMLVVDVSASMEATDVAPNRLQAAITAAEQFVSDIPESYDVGLIAYDKTATVLATPTTDRGELLASLASLHTGPGTATGDAIQVAVDTIAAHLQASTGTVASNAADTTTPGAATDQPAAAIVLLSDGKSTVGSSVEEGTQAAVDQGIPVTTIAYGTATGTVEVDGRTVAVPSDESAMAQIATTSGGASFTATNGAQLQQAYEDIQQYVGYTIEPREIMRMFIAIAIIALLAGVLASLVWSGRLL
jgi:Ca-activated chloride channel homolog